MARALQSYGSRIQYSIFECFLTPVQIVDLQGELASILEEEDQVLFVSLGGRLERGDDLTITSLGAPYTQRSLITII